MEMLALSGVLILLTVAASAHSLGLRIKSVLISSALSDPTSSTTIPDNSAGPYWGVTSSTGRLESASNSTKKLVFVSQYYSSGDNFRVFDWQGNLMSAGSSQIGCNYLDTVLPDFKLFTGSYHTTIDPGAENQ